MPLSAPTTSQVTITTFYWQKENVLGLNVTIGHIIRIHRAKVVPTWPSILCMCLGKTIQKIFSVSFFKTIKIQSACLCCTPFVTRGQELAKILNRTLVEKRGRVSRFLGFPSHTHTSASNARGQHTVRLGDIHTHARIVLA
jgi:hypothetical protein